MARIVLTENELISMVKDMARSCVNILTEAISSADAYQRFYKDIVSPEQWEALMKGAPMMTPLHKVVLDIIKDDGWDNELAELTIRAWNTLDGDGRKYLIDLINGAVSRNEGWLKCKGSVKNLLKHALEAPYHTEVKFSDNGLVKLYEDDKILVTCTLSYAASKKYYGDTHWCTASDITGRYNGFRMFWRYTEDEGGVLIQFVPKEDRRGAIQAHFYEDGSDGDVCDFFDRPVTLADAILLFESPEIANAVLESIPYIELFDKTLQMVDYERRYWENKRNAFEFKMEKTINDSVMSGGYDKAFLEYASEEIANHFHTWNRFATYDSEHASSEFNRVCVTYDGYILYNIRVGGLNQKEADFIYSVDNEWDEKANSITEYCFIVKAGGAVCGPDAKVVARFKGFFNRDQVSGGLARLSRYIYKYDSIEHDIIRIADGAVVAKNIFESDSYKNVVFYQNTREEYEDSIWHVLKAADGKYLGKFKGKENDIYSENSECQT